MPRLLTSLPRATRTLAKTTLTSSVLASGDWYRIAVTEEGIYKLDAAALTAMGITLASLDPRTIRIYGNGGKELSENPGDARPVDLVENAIYVEGESRRPVRFERTIILFYGRSPRGWTYSAARRTWDHYINHYTETNYYWLTVRRCARQAHGRPALIHGDALGGAWRSSPTWSRSKKRRSTS